MLGFEIRAISRHPRPKGHQSSVTSHDDESCVWMCRSYALVDGKWSCAAGFAGKAEVGERGRKMENVRNKKLETKHEVSSV